MAKRGNKKGSFVLLSVQSDENLILGFEEKTVKVQKLFYVAKKMWKDYFVWKQDVDSSLFAFTSIILIKRYSSK